MRLKEMMTERTVGVAFDRPRHTLTRTQEFIRIEEKRAP